MKVFYFVVVVNILGFAFTWTLALTLPGEGTLAFIGRFALLSVGLWCAMNAIKGVQIIGREKKAGHDETLAR